MCTFPILDIVPTHGEKSISNRFRKSPTKIAPHAEEHSAMNGEGGKQLPSALHCTPKQGLSSTDVYVFTIKIPPFLCRKNLLKPGKREELAFFTKENGKILRNPQSRAMRPHDLSGEETVSEVDTSPLPAPDQPGCHAHGNTILLYNVLQRVCTIKSTPAHSKRALHKGFV